MVNKLPKVKHIVISGYFSILHSGHVRYVQAAASLGKLTVIVNNDIQLEKKHGRVLVNEKERQFILAHVSGVTRVVLSVDEDDTVRKTLRLVHSLHPVDEFVNDGDVTACREADLCEELGIRCVYLGNPKVNSSSWIMGKMAGAAG